MKVQLWDRPRYTHGRLTTLIFPLLLGVAVLLNALDATADTLYSLTDLGSLGGGQSWATGINASGEVVGAASIPGNHVLHAFLYDGTMHDLGTLGGTNSYAYGINDSGQVVGVSDILTGPFQAFLYNGTMNALGTPGSGAFGINASGQVVGYDDSGAFLYDGTMHYLGTLGGIAPLCQYR